MTGGTLLILFTLLMLPVIRRQRPDEQPLTFRRKRW